MLVVAQNGYASYVFLAILAITVYVLLARAQRHSARTSRGRASPDPPGNQRGGYAFRQEALDEMTQCASQMQETSQELCARLESKMAALEERIREADRAAARLEAAVAAAERQIARVSDSPSEAAPPAGVDSPELPPVSQAEALRSAGTGDARPPVGSRNDDDTPARPAPERRYEEIYMLADYGLAPSEIAQRVGSPIGEVELILSLRGKR